MIAVRERFPDYFLHDESRVFVIKFPECLVILFAINEFDVNGHETLTNQKIIVDDASDPAVTINKWMGVLKHKMETRNAFDDILMTCGMIVSQHRFKTINNFFWVRSNMATDAHPLIILSKSSGDVVANT